MRSSPELVEDSGAMAEASKCRIALLGLADDTGVVMNNGRDGARAGPHAFRAALSRYGVAAPMDEPIDAPAYPRVFDAGDIVIGADIHETHARVTEAVLALLELGLFPVGIGGGHDLTFPLVRAVARAHGVMKGLYFDAHLDVRPEVGSGMPFHALLGERLADRVSVLGLDPMANTSEHLAWFLAHGGAALGNDAAPACVPGPAAQPAFVSLDLDVLDAAHAPGVSALNPCGMNPRQVGAWIDAVSRDPSVRCFDIMELNPSHDADGRTARLAAHMFLRFLRGIGERFREERVGS
ncbi:MAG: arginase family protein [Phycisphaeraceae bacterium]|nr:arginase family protein [Phycisphaeraceae bacterium]